MKKSSLFFTVYIENEQLKDLEAVGTFDKIEEVRRFLNVSKGMLINNGLRKKVNLKLKLKIKDEIYYIIIDSE